MLVVCIIFRKPSVRNLLYERKSVKILIPTQWTGHLEAMKSLSKIFHMTIDHMSYRNNGFVVLDHRQFDGEYQYSQRNQGYVERIDISVFDLRDEEY